MTEDQLEQEALHVTSRFSIHVPLDVYKNTDFLYITSTVSE